MRMIATRETFALVALGLLLAAAVPPAAAQDSTPASGPETGSVSVTKAAPAGHTELRGQLGASINNAGAQLSFDLSRQRPLSGSRHPLLSEAHVGFGGSAAFTPAHLRTGVWLEAAPVSIFFLRVGAEQAYYFGTFDSLTRFDSRLASFDTDSRHDRGGAEAGTAARIYVTPTLRLRAGRFIGLASADLEWWSSNAAGPLFYEPTRDTLLDVGGDRLTTVTSAVLYEHPLATGRLTVGVTHSRMRTGNASLNEVQRLGVVAVRQYDRRFLSLDRPSVTISAAHYLDDPVQTRWMDRLNGDRLLAPPLDV